VPNRRPQLEIVAPGAASPEEAAAVVAAVERFLRDHAPVLVAEPERPGGWQRAALLEATGRGPEVGGWDPLGGAPGPWA
jgi:hypothetical protein